MISGGENNCNSILGSGSFSLLFLIVPMPLIILGIVNEHINAIPSLYLIFHTENVTTVFSSNII